MATLLFFEVMSGKFSTVEICTSGDTNRNGLLNRAVMNI